MNNRGTRGKNLLNKVFGIKGRTGRLPLTISLLFFISTSAWILFEHEYLGMWGLIEKDFFWAVLSTGVLFLLLYYGVSVIQKAEATVKESEKRLLRILETSTSGIIVVDDKGNYAYANLEAAEILGIPRSDLVGRNYRDRPWEITTVDGRPYPDEDLPFSRVQKTGMAVYGAELAVRRRDGTRLILLVNSAPLHDPDGNIAGMIASFFDVTARREAEDLNLRKLRLAVEQSPSAIAITDKKGRIEYANPMFLRITGYPREALLDGVKP
ncbi:MAG: PAS domain S-box protein, partial [Deltaproteobacteria bacterium]|nr:PAS domain S-box protein [Deltaproteobacteria bacterium]